MAWNATDNTWTTPNTSFGAPEWENIYSTLKKKYTNWDTMTAQKRLEAFNDWWNVGGGKTSWANQWQTAYNPWQQLYNDWLADQAGTTWTGTQPTAPDLTAVTDWTTNQLEGEGDQQGINDIIAALAGEAAGGGSQYYDEWLSRYAEQAGFNTPEEYQAMMAEEQGRKERFLDLMEEAANNQRTGTVSPEQQKMIREQQRMQEEAARKQAIASYQETGSYAALQRASDELNQASLNQAIKSQMEMANQNFATALAAANQQTETVMRSIEAGDQSFMYYVQAKQQGVQTALAAWQDQAANILQQAEQQMYALQTEFGNDQAQYAQSYQEFEDMKAALDRQGDLITQAAAAALGITGADQWSDISMAQAMEDFYNQIETELANAATVENEGNEADAAQNTASTSSAVGVLLMGLGLVIALVPGAQVVGLGMMGTGAGLLATNLGEATS